MENIKVGDRVKVLEVLYPADFGFAIGYEGRVISVSDSTAEVMVNGRRGIATTVERVSSDAEETTTPNAEGPAAADVPENGELHAEAVEVVVTEAPAKEEAPKAKSKSKK